MPELFDPEHIRIHDLTIEAPPETSETLDVRDEITEEDWLKITESIHDHLPRTDTLSGGEDFSDLLFSLKVLSPKRFAELQPTVLERAWQKLNTCLIGALHVFDLNNARSGTLVVKMLGFMNYLFPDRVPSQQPTTDQWHKLQHDLDNAVGGNFFLIEDVADIAFFNLLNSSTGANPLRIPEDRKAEFLDLIQDTLDTDEPEYDTVLIIGPVAKVVSPLKMGKIKISEEDWQALKEELSEQRHIYLPTFALNAVRLQILASSETRITENGLEIIMPSDDLNGRATEELPVTRKY